MLFAPVLLPAQAPFNAEKAADKAFDKGAYQKAYLLYKKQVSPAVTDMDLWYKYAESARMVNHYSEAEKYYTKILENRNADQFKMTRFWLAQIKKNLGKYDQAIELFKYFTFMTIDQYYTNWAAKEVYNCQSIIDQSAAIHSTDIQVDVLNDNINTYYSETAPFEMGNHLYYSTMRSIYRDDKHEPKRHMNKMMVSKNLERSRPVPNEFSEEGKHVGHTAFSSDWQRMYFSVCEYVGEEEIKCALYYRDQDKKGRWKKESVRLPDPVNLKEFSQEQPAIALDASTGQEVLYFVSNRVGGIGDKDIWFCQIEKNGFSEVKNLWQVNTPEADISPFFHQETQTLSFSSKGHAGYGGFDIFQIQKDGEYWSEVSNLGTPINSGWDEVFYSKNQPGNRAYFSSNRKGAKYHRSLFEGASLDVFRVYYRQLTVSGQ